MNTFSKRKCHKMMINAIRELTAAQALDRLRNAGSIMGEIALKDGIEQGVFPFGVCVHSSGKKRTFIIYEALLEKWIAERSAPEECPE